MSDQYDAYNEFATHHEDQATVVLEELRTKPIWRVEWERQHVGGRIAPSIDVLRNGFGYVINGHGTKDDPYVLADKCQLPTKEKVQNDTKNLYYETEHWTSKRQERLDFDNHMCVFCHDSENLHVHHWKYDLFHERIEHLSTLCKECHEFVHQICRIGWPQGVSIEIADRIRNEHC